MMCYEYDNIRPDVVLLGKALSGGSKLHLSLLLEYRSADTHLSISVPGGGGAR